MKKKTPIVLPRTNYEALPPYLSIQYMYHSQHFIGDRAANGMIEREKGGKEGGADGVRARRGSEYLDGC